MGVVFLYLLVHMSKNFIEDKPLINPKIFSSITREDDFYSVLIKFAEEVTFLYSSEEDKKNSRTLNQDNLKTMYSYGIVILIDVYINYIYAYKILILLIL